MSKRHGRHSTARKREIVEAYLNGEALHALGKQHDVCRSLIRIEKHERGEHDDDDAEADLLPDYESRIAAGGWVVPLESGSLLSANAHIAYIVILLGC